MKDTFPLLSQEILRNFSFRISVPETGQRPNIYGFIINHNITDSREPKPVQNSEQENAEDWTTLAKGRLESQGEGRGLEPVNEPCLTPLPPVRSLGVQTDPDL